MAHAHPGATVAEDQSADITLSGSDANGDKLTYVVTTPPAHGMVIMVGSLASYTPDADYNGSDSFQFVVTDGEETSDAVTVPITVTAVNDAPVFTSADAASIVENTAMVMSLAATDVDGDPPSFSISGGDDAGSFVIKDGALRFIATPDYDLPSDGDENNVYEVVLSATDGAAATTQNVAVTVTDGEEAITLPRMVSIPAGAFTQGDQTANVEVDWYRDSADGDELADGSWRSGRIGDDQEVDLAWSGNTGTTVSFWFKTDTEEDNDYLQFLVDGDVVQEWSGVNDWTEYTATVTDASHDLVWRYAKDGLVFTGSDSVWVDGITINGSLMTNSSFTTRDITSVGIGDDDERPSRSVTISQPFEMSAFEITNEQYVAMLNWALDPDGDQETEDALIEIDDPTDPMVVRNVLTDPSNGTNWSQEDLLYLDDDCQIIWETNRFGLRNVAGHPDGSIDSRDDHPMLTINWYGSLFYCWALDRSMGEDSPISLVDWSVNKDVAGWRLPTEAELEYAARAGGSAIYPWGDAITGSEANYADYNAGYDAILPYTSPVGSFSANAFGLYDMAGNVFEWCQDYYHADAYDGLTSDGVDEDDNVIDGLDNDDKGEAVTDPWGPNSGVFRCVRGGSFDSSAYALRTTYRAYGWADENYTDVGFRPVKVQGAPAANQ